MAAVLDLQRRWRSGRSAARGSILAAVLVMMAIGAVWAGVASTHWSFIMKREREKELIFRGTQIVKGLEEFSAGGALPTSLKQMTKFPKPTLRQEWADPMTALYDSTGELIEGTGRWKLLVRDAGGGATPPPTASAPTSASSTIAIQPLRGVASTSEEESIGGYRNVPPGGPYSEWQFEGFALRTDVQSLSTGAFQGGYDLSRPPGFGGFRQPGGPPVPPSMGSSSPGGARPPGAPPPRLPPRGTSAGG